jgi:MFS family permease
MASAEVAKQSPDRASAGSMSAGLTLPEASGKWVVAAAVLGSGMASLDAIVVNIALPALGRDLHAGFDALQWIISGYTLTLASLILLGGALGDRFGRRRMFIIGTVWFALASALCALAPSVEVLVAARALEGVGGALLTHGSPAMIQASFAEQDCGKAIGAWSGFGGVASAIGPFIGGFLVEGPGWRWVFFDKSACGGAFCRHPAPTLCPNPMIPTRPSTSIRCCSRGDRPGRVTYALIGASGGWSGVGVLALVLGLMALGAFVVNERRSPNPMVPPAMFRNQQFAAANVVTFLVYGALGGLFFFLVMDLQVVAGFSPVLSGSALLPVTVIVLLLSAQAGALSAKIHSGPSLRRGRRYQQLD